MMIIRIRGEEDAQNLFDDAMKMDQLMSTRPPDLVIVIKINPVIY